MKWINLEHLLLPAEAARAVTFAPTLDHAGLTAQALQLAAGLHKRGVRSVAIHLEDAAQLAVALLGAWRAGVHVLLPADLQAQTRQRWADQVDLWLSEQDQLPEALFDTALPAAELDLQACRVSLCTSGSSGEPKRIDKQLKQLATEVAVLEQLWGADLGQACIIGSVATQHIYGLLFRVLWPLCAGRPLVRRQLPFPEDLQRASREYPAFA